MSRRAEQGSEKEDLIGNLLRQGLIARNRSCGKCIPCREGTKRVLELIDRYASGKGFPGDLQMIEQLARVIEQTALCRIGINISNPIFKLVQDIKEQERTPEVACKISEVR